MATLNLAHAVLGVEAPQRTAVREPTRSWTYGELRDAVERLAGGLAELGVERGDRVAVLMPDGLEAAASILGAVWAGGVAVPLSELYRPNDVRALVRDAGAVVAIVHADLEPVLDEVRADMTSLREVVVVGPARGGQRSFASMLAEARPAPPAPTYEDEPALLLYSAGPSARPRGVPHAHTTPLHSHRAWARGVLGLSVTDRVLCLARMTTSFGLGAGLLFPLVAGAEAILLPEQARSRAVFELMRSAKPTIVCATPSLYGQLLADVTPQDGPFDDLRVCVAGSEMLPERLAERVRERFGVEVLGGYGLTEAFHFVIANPPGRSRPGSAGLVVPGYQARVVADDGRILRAEEIGRLEIAGPTVAQEYWNQLDDTKPHFADGWLRTSDRFMVGPDGYFYHCGRTDDLFKVGGKWVSPGEVEQTLLGHPAVWECAVVGVEDQEGLTKPVAFVVPNVGHHPGAALEKELIEYVKREIAPYKYPRWIEFVEKLPKGAHGKVLRYKLSWKPRPRQITGPLPSGAGE